MPTSGSPSTEAVSEVLGAALSLALVAVVTFSAFLVLAQIQDQSRAASQYIQVDRAAADVAGAANLALAQVAQAPATPLVEIPVHAPYSVEASAYGIRLESQGTVLAVMGTSERSRYVIPLASDFAICPSSASGPMQVVYGDPSPLPCPNPSLFLRSMP